jgi:hypothetical protein
MSIGGLLLALLAGAVVLMIVGPVRGLSEKRFGAYAGMMKGLQIQPSGAEVRPWLMRMMGAAILLEVIVPGVLYAVFAEELGRSNPLLGMIFFGGAWVIGALPQFVFEPMLIRVPRRFVIHNIVASLIIYLLIGFTIGLIYPV